MNICPIREASLSHHTLSLHRSLFKPTQEPETGDLFLAYWPKLFTKLLTKHLFNVIFLFLLLSGLYDEDPEIVTLSKTDFGEWGFVSFICDCLGSCLNITVVSNNLPRCVFIGALAPSLWLIFNFWPLTFNLHRAISVWWRHMVCQFLLPTLPSLSRPGSNSRCPFFSHFK